MHVVVCWTWMAKHDALLPIGAEVGASTCVLCDLPDPGIGR